MKKIALALALTLGTLSAVEIAAPGSIVSQAKAANVHDVIYRRDGVVIAVYHYDTAKEANDHARSLRDFARRNPHLKITVSVQVRDDNIPWNQFEN
jgi:hypothetical protein